jgi:hypothetical protein
MHSKVSARNILFKKGKNREESEQKAKQRKEQNKEKQGRETSGAKAEEQHTVQKCCDEKYFNPFPKKPFLDNKLWNHSSKMVWSSNWRSSRNRSQRESQKRNPSILAAKRNFIQEETIYQSS